MTTSLGFTLTRRQWTIVISCWWDEMPLNGSTTPAYPTTLTSPLCDDVHRHHSLSECIWPLCPSLPLKLMLRFFFYEHWLSRFPWGLLWEKPSSGSVNDPPASVGTAQGVGTVPTSAGWGFGVEGIAVCVWLTSWHSGGFSSEAGRVDRPGRWRPFRDDGNAGGSVSAAQVPTKPRTLDVRHPWDRGCWEVHSGEIWFITRL